jgi:hypothetical protein
VFEMTDSMLRTALAVSAALHGLFGVWVEVRGDARAPELREVADSWSGPGIEVDSVPAPAEAAPAGAPPAEQAREAVPEATAAAPTEPRVMLPHAEPSPTSPRKPRVSSPSHVSRVAPPDAAASTAASVTSATASGSSAEPFGAQGLPPGVRHLPKAFTRALSIADRGDPRWLTLPAGPAGEARIELPVAEDGKLGELSYTDQDERDKLAPVVRHLLENTRLLLESGHFSLDSASLRAGVERLRVRVEVVEPPAAGDSEGDPNELKELEYEPPTHGKPGRGSFALNSGRRVIGWVYLE